MKLLIDTTYLLPAIGVAIRHLPRTIVRDLRGRGHVISISTMTIFELAAKGARFVRDGKLTQERVHEGLAAVLNDKALGQIHFQELEVLERAITMRAQISDFIDCIILCSAAVSSDALVSEDEELRDLVSQGDIRAKLNPTNDAFAAYPSREVP